VVGAGHGVGVGESAEVNATVVYKGASVTVRP